MPCRSIAVGDAVLLLLLLLLLLCLQDYINSQPKAKKAMARVDDYLFAATNVGDSDFDTAFNQLVDARR
jgi:hypothetical protein